MHLMLHNELLDCHADVNVAQFTALVAYRAGALDTVGSLTRRSLAALGLIADGVPQPLRTDVPCYNQGMADSAIERASAYGIDVSLLVENLSYSPTERVRRAQRSIRAALALRQAFQRGGSTERDSRDSSDDRHST
jgi:hypothetical protein